KGRRGAASTNLRSALGWVCAKSTQLSKRTEAVWIRIVNLLLYGLEEREGEHVGSRSDGDVLFAVCFVSNGGSRKVVARVVMPEMFAVGSIEGNHVAVIISAEYDA